MLDGAPELRTPARIRKLGRGAVVAFPAGPDGARAVRNHGPDPARLLTVSTAVYPDIAEYPDGGETMTITGSGEGRAFTGGADVPYFPLASAAIEASWAD